MPSIAMDFHIQTFAPLNVHFKPIRKLSLYTVTFKG